MVIVIVIVMVMVIVIVIVTFIIVARIVGPYSTKGRP